MITKLKLIAAGVLLLALVSGWNALKYYRHKAEAEKAKRVVSEKREEVKDDQKEREKKVDDMSGDDLLNYWRGVPDRPHGGQTPAPPEAQPGKFDQGPQR